MSSTAQSIRLRSRSSVLLRDYAELFKARVTTLIVLTAWCGAYFAVARSGASAISVGVLNAIMGIGLVAAGAAGLNEVIERELDAKMRRTSMRPLVTGTMSVAHATAVSLAAVLGGTIYLAAACNGLTAGLALLTCIVYLAAYTPMKRVAPICTFLGAFPGAMPPVLGWVAVRGHLDWQALVLFAIVFFWQFPHFHSIALLYREDYDRAGIRMLAVVDREGTATAKAIVVNSLILLPATVLPTLLGMSGRFYCVAAVALTIVLFWYGLRILRLRTDREPSQTRRLARQLLQATVFYLPALFALMMLNRT